MIKWNYFAKDTVGKQLVKAIDSVSANISEALKRLPKDIHSLIRFANERLNVKQFGNLTMQQFNNVAI